MTTSSGSRELERWGRRKRGEVIADRYRLDDIVGSGGMGTVFLGHHLELKTPVAIKLLKAALSKRELFTQRFRREARVAARLRHPGAVQIHDFGSHDGQAYIVMELVDGEPLSDAIRNHPDELTAERCVRIARALADVLSAAHTLSIIHRDLKPDNIIVDLQGPDREWVTVIDFGLAFVNQERELDVGPDREVEGDFEPLEDEDEGEDAGIRTLFEIGRLTEAGRTAGTPRYVSPEQARGVELTGAADIYSFGCVLYEMLAARPPFVGRTAPDIVNQHLFVAPRPPSRSAPGVPAWLDEVTMRMLDKRPHARPTAADLVALFDEHLQGGREDGGRGSFRLPQRSERVVKSPSLERFAALDDLDDPGGHARIVTVLGRPIPDALVIAFRINGLTPEPADEASEDGVAPDAVAALLHVSDPEMVTRLTQRGVTVVCEEDPEAFPTLTQLLCAGATEVIAKDRQASEVARTVARAINTRERRRNRA
jgi:serine/threonine protein kinase